MEQYSHVQKKKMADKPQEKLSSLLPFSNASEVVQYDFSSEELVMVWPPQFLPEMSLKSRQSSRERNYSGILLQVLIITRRDII
jgi:hypothetical protein